MINYQTSLISYEPYYYLYVLFRTNTTRRLKISEAKCLRRATDHNIIAVYCYGDDTTVVMTLLRRSNVNNQTTSGPHGRGARA